MNPSEHIPADYGLIGRPLGHSQSKAFFTALFAARGSSEVYANFELSELTPAALYGLVLLNPRLKGFNVTAPYKEEIMNYLDRLSPEAERVEAVNTVKVIRSEDGRVLALEGYNTDVEGFRESVSPMCARLTPEQGALVLGTGGASKAVVAALATLGVPSLRVSRTKVGDGIVDYGSIDEALLRRMPLVVNATPAGTWPNTESCPPFPYGLLTEACMCHDLVYNPAETTFMRLARERGAEVKNGLDMLHGQALASLKIWNK
ncbi:MAG: shikimate dehydrogenase [Muribaculaceae bacterium]|nr:shikimate dehydrogenase [Muribaculaceae bacterium]